MGLAVFLIFNKLRLPSPGQHNIVVKFADSLDSDRDFIARVDRSYPWWRTSKDDIATLQRHDPGDKLHQLNR